MSPEERYALNSMTSLCYVCKTSCTLHTCYIQSIRNHGEGTLLLNSFTVNLAQWVVSCVEGPFLSLFNSRYSHFFRTGITDSTAPTECQKSYSFGKRSLGQFENTSRCVQGFFSGGNATRAGPSCPVL
jgi:hypothetical protein